MAYVQGATFFCHRCPGAALTRRRPARWPRDPAQLGAGLRPAPAASGTGRPLARRRPADIVAAICGAHAQIMSAAELSIGLRLAGATRATVRAALWGERSLVKTFGPRGTVHLLPARDLALWTGALGAVPPRRPPPGVRLTPDQTDELLAAIGAALADTELTVDELTEAIVAACGPWAGERTMPAFNGFWPRWRQVVGTAANPGRFASAPTGGATSPTPTRAAGSPASARRGPRRRRRTRPALPARLRPGDAAALRPVAERAPPRWATDLFAALGDELRPVTVEGTAAWALADDAAPPPAAPYGLRLLPYFDAYVVGCQPRAFLYPGPAAARALARGQAGNFPVLLIDGVVAGVWHQRRAGRRSTSPSSPSPPSPPPCAARSTRRWRAPGPSSKERRS